MLEVTKNLSLYKHSFVYEGKDYSYHGISSLSFVGSSQTINLINIGSGASLCITHEDRVISVTADSYIIKTTKLKNIGKAANMLFQATFNTRLKRYVDKLQSVGYFVYPNDKKEVTIFANGDVTDGAHKFNLVVARDKKCLQIGYDVRLGGDAISDSYEVIVSESGTAIWHKKITFWIHNDYDVMVFLLKSLSGSTDH